MKITFILLVSTLFLAGCSGQTSVVKSDLDSKYTDIQSYSIDSSAVTLTIKEQ